MGLVDYSDSESSGESEIEQARKRLKPSIVGTTSQALPPLPSSFHDLYASTVRPSTSDNPALHQGRKRQIPHVSGNWPSHIYIDWHPTPSEHEVLADLVDCVSAKLGEVGDAFETKVESFLTSELGVPLPLHISLSRPFVLRADERDRFGDELCARLGSSQLTGVELKVAGLQWFRSLDSERSFLVLKVAGCSDDGMHSNQELSALLSRCNKLVGDYGQPVLYAKEGDADSSSKGMVNGEAFHVSVAWSFLKPTDDFCSTTAEVFARSEYAAAVRDIRIAVDSVKLKMGNVITSIPLQTATRSKANEK